MNGGASSPGLVGTLLGALFQSKYGLLLLNAVMLLWMLFLYKDKGDFVHAGYNYNPAEPAQKELELNDAQIGKTATVMAMATGYALKDYKRFVGSLRKTGFEGNIILAVAPDIDTACETYLASQNVFLHKVQHTTCSHPVKKGAKVKIPKNSHERELVTCLHPYPKLKHRWARFPLLRDYLLHCGGHANPEVQCGGPVLITDMRDTFFQRNPFGTEAPKVTGLQLFAEHYTIRTTHWLVDWPVGDCKGVHYDEPMLCSGTTIGTRQAMLDYLRIFHEEMNLWMESPKCCCFETNGDDQSMHNYMYYSHMLDGVDGGVTVSKNRNGLVHTAGAQLSMIYNTHTQQKKELREALKNPNKPTRDAHHHPLDKSYDEKDDTKNWLGLHYGLTDQDGYFVDYDGSRSFVVHQYDRIGSHFVNWLDKNQGI